jgi:hypothetical protein
LENIVNLKFPALATVLLLTSAFTLAEPAKAPADKNGNAAVACTDASGAAAAKRDQAPAASSAARTREEVYAEAVEAARNHRSTFSRDLDFLKN